MKTILLYLFTLFAAGQIFAQVTISGTNEAQFVYRISSKSENNNQISHTAIDSQFRSDTEDSLRSFFHNETNLRFHYRFLELGLTFLADLPRYNSFETVKDLTPDIIDYRWDYFYLIATFPNFMLKAGNFSEFFGSGMVFRSHYDKYYDLDTRLDGVAMQYDSDILNLKTLYGTLPNRIDEGKNDIAAGIDLSSLYFSFIQPGISVLSSREILFENLYSNRTVVGGRAELSYRNYNLYSEYAESRLKSNIAPTVKGSALYGYVYGYFNILSLMAGYKNYQKFDYQLNDVPMLNSSGEPLTSDVSGLDEEGVMGTIHILPDSHTEIELSYSEAWTSSKSNYQSDLLIKGKRDFQNFTATVEYGQIEHTDELKKEWTQEIVPTFGIEFKMLNLPVGLKTGYKIVSLETTDNDTVTYSPYLQTDLFFKRISLSGSIETDYNELNDLSKSSPFWINLSFRTYLFEHSDLRVFIGKEKGGKSCRNGYCFKSPPFSGLKIDLTTRF